MLPTTRPDEQLSKVLPGPPVALRAFPPNDELAVFAEVYDNAASSPHKVDITTTVTSDDGKVVFKTDEERSSTDIQGKRGGYGYQARIPLRDLAPGHLRAEGRSAVAPRSGRDGESRSAVHGRRPARRAPGDMMMMTLMLAAVLQTAAPADGKAISMKTIDKGSADEGGRAAAGHGALGR